jgi:hypothetical protein
MPATGEPLHGATPRMLVAIEAIAEALFSSADGAPPRERIEWLSHEMDDFLARAGARSRFVFRLSLLAVSMLAPLLLWRFAPLRALPLGERTEALERMERGRLALPLLAIKAMLCIVYYEHPDAADEIGFDGACLLTKRAT